MYYESESWSNSKGTQLRGISGSVRDVVVLQEIEPKVRFLILQGLYTHHDVKCGNTWSRVIKFSFLSPLMPHKGVHEFTPSKHGHILALKDEGYTYRAIADQVGGCTASAVHKTVKHNENYDTQKSLPRSG